MSAFEFILIFYIGFYFYRLAENHKKNKWVFGVLGIIIYFIGNSLYPIYLSIFKTRKLDEFDTALIGLKSTLIGFITMFVLFHLLSFSWSRKEKQKKEEIDKIGKINH